VRTGTGRCLSGSGNRKRRISPRATFPATRLLRPMRQTRRDRQECAHRLRARDARYPPCAGAADVPGAHHGSGPNTLSRRATRSAERSRSSSITTCIVVMCGTYSTPDFTSKMVCAPEMTIRICTQIDPATPKQRITLGRFGPLRCLPCKPLNRRDLGGIEKRRFDPTRFSWVALVTL
jgi:hypothetical protein